MVVNNLRNMPNADESYWVFIRVSRFTLRMCIVGVDTQYLAQIA